MTTAAQIAANRKNALASTGPRTGDGKARSARNALRFGIYSEMPAVLGLERAEEWDAFRDGIVTNLTPLGTLEEALAERVAVCLWRLRRTVWFETAVTAAGLEVVEQQFEPKVPDEKEDKDRSRLLDEDNLPPEEALPKAETELTKKKDRVEGWEGTLQLLEQLPDLPDEVRVVADDVFGVFQDLMNELPDDGFVEVEEAEFLSKVGVPPDQHDDAYTWEGWTAGMVKKGVARIANEFKRNPDTLLAKATRSRRQAQVEDREAIQAAERRIKDLRRQVRERRDRTLRGHILPDTNALQKVAPTKRTCRDR
jgi:hypothetical protein